MYRLSRLQKHKIYSFRESRLPKEPAFFMRERGSVAVITIVPFLILANAK